MRESTSLGVRCASRHVLGLLFIIFQCFNALCALYIDLYVEKAFLKLYKLSIYSAGMTHECGLMTHTGGLFPTLVG